MIDYQTVADWSIAKAQLDHWKATEMRLRKTICDELFENRVGRFTSIKIIDGPDNSVQVKAKSVSNFSVNEVMLNDLVAAELLTLEDTACFERKLKIKDSLLNKRPGDSPVWRAITQKPGAPKLEVTTVDDET
jgi:hypothetical protein